MSLPPGSAPDGVGGVVKLNPRAEPFIQTVSKTLKQHRRGKREDGENPGSKHQTRPRQGRWTGGRGAGRPNPSRKTKIPGANVGKERISVFVRNEKNCRKEETPSEKEETAGTRGTSTGRQEGGRNPHECLSAGGYHSYVRTMAVDGTHGVGRVLEVLSVYNDSRC